MGVSGAVSPVAIDVSTRFVAYDLPVGLASSFLLVVYAWRGRPVGRRAGGGLAAAYGAYLATLVLIV